MIDPERIRRGWDELEDMVNDALIRWRAEHPRATLAEIEQAIEEGIRQIRGRSLDDLAAASPTADLATMAVAERPAGSVPAPRRGRRSRATNSRQAARRRDACDIPRMMCAPECGGAAGRWQRGADRRSSN